MTIPAPLEAVIFDMDGTLLDTERVAREAIFAACDRLGYPMTEALHLRMVGTPQEASDILLREHFGADFPLETFWAQSESALHGACESGCPLRPGAEAILRLLRGSGIPVGLATSTSRVQALQRLEQAGISALLDVIVTRTDVTHGKPHPETFLVAAKALIARPAQCLAVEDSYLGVYAAVAAGIPTVMIPDLLIPTAEMRSVCLAILPDLEALRQKLSQTPAHRSGVESIVP